MALTKVDIVNHALSLIDEEELADLNGTDDVTIKVNRFLQTTVDEIASYHEWNFFTKRTQLTGGTALTEGLEYSYKHTLPADVLSVRRITTRNTTATYKQGYTNTRWQIIGREMYTEFDDVDIEYISKPDLDNISDLEYSPKLKKCIYYSLASKLAYSIFADIGKHERLESQLINVILPEARMNDELEQDRRRWKRSDWLQAYQEDMYVDIDVEPST